MAAKQRERKPNFTSSESNLISSRATEMLDTIRGRHSNDLSNTMKQDFWKCLTEEVNALGVACRSEDEVRNRWRNMSRSAKEKFTNHRLVRQKTGGGPPPAALSVAEEQIVDAMQDTAAYIGVPGGQESAVTQLDAGNSSTCTVEKSWDDDIRRIAGQPPEQLFADDAEDDAAVTPVAGPSSASSTQGQKRCQDVQATKNISSEEEKDGRRCVFYPVCLL
ncbi:uncharacterized protein LOC117318892 [Pecten maximus]|uniref:uncharacterized protein LOC117318892 n=1 Tax=Pecten maximus TaxID=6579 RepID=UPI0014589A74|nr:uncharacterized protein LOC117318892 [Pecten maximus]